MARTPLRQTDPPRIGRYRLLARLGAGGMGVVYLGVDPSGEQVAVKVLRPELADNPEFRVRFGREVTMLTRVQGMCTVRVIAADTEAPNPFLVTEYADGPSLSEYIDTRGPLDAGMLYGLATGLAEALTAIHAAGIVHRDLKPSNVVLTASGPKVIDFGIAQALDTTSLTRTGITVGSAGFMAPEQVMGKAGTAADIFTWAVTVAYAASGQPPFGTGTSDVILYRIVHVAPDITAVPPGLRPLVEAALAKEPRDRPTAPQLLSQLTQSTVARPSVGDGNLTQTILAQTWHPSGPGPAAPGPAVPPPHPTVPAPGTAPPAGHRSSRRRTALLPVVLTLAFLLAAGGTAVGFALAGGSGGAHGPAGASTTQTRPAQSTPATTHGTTTTPPTSPASSATTPATSTPATTSPATTTPATTTPSHHEPGHHDPGHHDPGHHRTSGHHDPGHHLRHHDPGHHAPRPARADSSLRSWWPTATAGAGPASGRDDNPAYCVSVGQPMQGAGHLLQADPLADQRPDRALGDQLGELPVALADELGHLGLVQAPVQPHDRVVLDQRVVQRGRRDLPAGEAYDQDPALERDALGGPGVRLAAHRVVDHVGAAPAGDLLDHLDEVLAAPVDRPRPRRDRGPPRPSARRPPRR